MLDALMMSASLSLQGEVLHLLGEAHCDGGHLSADDVPQAPLRAGLQKPG